MAHMDLGIEPVATQRYGEAVRFAATGARAHEDRRCFTPELELQGRGRAQRGVRPAERHHCACRSASELRALVEIWRRVIEAGQVGREPLLEAQRMAAILVIMEVPAEH